MWDGGRVEGWWESGGMSVEGWWDECGMVG